MFSGAIEMWDCLVCIVVEGRDELGFPGKCTCSGCELVIRILVYFGLCIGSEWFL